MVEHKKTSLSFDEFDEQHNPRPEECDFDGVVERALSRRGFLGSTLVMSTAAFVMGTTALTPRMARAAGRFGFDQVAANTLGTITVPDGYSWHMVVKWGDPLWPDSIEFDPTTRGTGASQERPFGDNNDGMSLFHHNGHNVLAVNNEYTNRDII